MPHYKDGTPAAIGDKVRGPITYPVPGEIEGFVTNLVESDKCNMTVAYLNKYKVTTDKNGNPNQGVNGLLFRQEDGLCMVNVGWYTAAQCAEFVKVEG